MCLRRWIRGDVLVVLAVLAAAALFFVLRPSQGAAAACVSVGDSPCREIPLTQEQAGLHTYTDEGVTYTVEVQPGRIRMVEIDCPDGICVKTGWVDGGTPIVCLPNRLIIEVKGGDGLA